MTNNAIILRDTWFVEDSKMVKIWKDETLSKLVDVPVYIYRPKIQPCPIRGAFAVPGFDVIMIPADWRLSELWDIMGLGMLYHEVGHLRDPEAANQPYYQKGSTIVGYAASDVAHFGKKAIRSEAAADRFACLHGYAINLYNFLCEVLRRKERLGGSLIGDIPDRIKRIEHYIRTGEYPIADALDHLPTIQEMNICDRMLLNI